MDKAQQMQQLQRGLNKQVLDRAEADPQWRRQFIEEPHTAMSEIPEARQITEMYERAGPTEEQSQEAAMLREKVLDKAANDPQWKQQLIDDEEAAMREANFPEYQQQLEQGAQQSSEVEGHGIEGPFNLAKVSSLAYAPSEGVVTGPAPRHVCNWWDYSPSGGWSCAS